MGACADCSRALPDESFRFCPWCGAPLTELAPGQRKTVTVMMADLVDSTRLGAALDPEVLRSVMTSYWAVARTAIEHHGGQVAKFIGDAAVGVFGIPAAHDDDALRAVRSADDLCRAIEELNLDLDQRLGVRLAVRVGVNTGPVMTDAVGGDVSLLAADVANVCSRIEQAAQPGEVLVGESTFLLVRDRVQATRIEPFPVKGKDDLVTAFRLDSAEPATGRPSRNRAFGTLVGRLDDLVAATTAYEEACRTFGCTVLTVVGAPGVGKSRLVDELRAHVLADALVLEGRCLPYGDGITYWPLVQMLHPLLDAEPLPWVTQLGEVERAQEIGQGLDSIMGAQSAVSGDQMSWAFRRLVEALAVNRPVVVIVDDVQWAEPALLDLLEHLAEQSHGARILVVCMARPEFIALRPAWGSAWPSARTIHLSALSTTDSSDLVERLLGSAVDPLVLDRIVSASGGVPLFIEEVVASLVEDDSIRADAAGLWGAVVDLADLQIPPTVLALVTARLDRLPRSARQVIEAAAVIGQTFYRDALITMVSPDVDLAASIEFLVLAHLIGPSGTDIVGHDAFSFGHLLIHDAAYDSTPKARRAVQHQAYARWLDRTAVGRVAPELVAAHLERAAGYLIELGHRDEDLSAEASDRLMACADRAKQSGDLPSAVSLLAAAARLQDENSPLGLAVMLSRVDVDVMAGDLEGAVELARRAQDVAESRGDVEARWNAWVLMSWVVLLTDSELDFGALSDQLDEAIAVLDSRGADRALAMAYFVRCTERWALGRLDDVSTIARLGIEAAQRCGDVTLVARLLELLMIAAWFGPATLAEEESFVSDVGSEFGDDPLLARDIATFRAVLLADQGHVDDAVAYATEGVAFALERGNPYAALDFQNLISHQVRVSGDLNRAAESMRAALELAERSGITTMMSTLFAELAFVLSQQGHVEEARSYLVKSDELGHPSDVINRALAAMTEGVLHAHDGRREAADGAFADAVEALGQTQFTGMYVELWLARSTACEVLGVPAQALACAQEAWAFAESRGRIPPILRVRRRIAECEALVSGG